MTLSLLKKIETATLPLQLTQRAEMDEAQLLRAADLVAALFLRTAGDAPAPPHRVARVLAITPRGRALLAAERPPEPGEPGGAVNGSLFATATPPQPPATRHGGAGAGAP
ncbi:hypothetical protein [Pseudorhodoferax soli]|uniref:Uncharacterized protein n=1 Tax=Pseudorhodoferax soli TaxID=545864 RepID=A0A368XWP5_9BURK|nr:hypothetical protein [Pseudorhodoferax soli]RCW72500.1 hypothetical protein DES41_103105 [Pseudorhodoferax soli]